MHRIVLQIYLADISKTPIVVKGCTECAQMTNFHSWLGKTPWILTDWLCAGSMHALYQPKVVFYQSAGHLEEVY